MKLLRHVTLLLILAAMTMVCSTLGMSQQVETGRLDRKWHAKLYKKNRDHIEIKIDTRSLDRPLYDVKVHVKFFKGKETLGKQTFNFTDEKLKILTKRDRPTVRYFPHDFSGAGTAKGDTIYYITGAIVKSDLPPSSPNNPNIPAMAGVWEEPPLIKFFRRLFSFFRKEPKPFVIGPVPERK